MRKQDEVQIHGPVSYPCSALFRVDLTNNIIRASTVFMGQRSIEFGGRYWLPLLWSPYIQLGLKSATHIVLSPISCLAHMFGLVSMADLEEIASRDMCVIESLGFSSCS